MATRASEYEQISPSETGSSSSSHSSARSAASSASSASSAVPSLPSIEPPSKPPRRPSKSKLRKRRDKERNRVDKNAENLHEYHFDRKEVYGGENGSKNGQIRRHRRNNHRAPLASIPSESNVNRNNVESRVSKGVKVLSPTAKIRMKKVPQMTGGYASKH